MSLRLLPPVIESLAVTVAELTLKKLKTESAALGSALSSLLKRIVPSSAIL